MPICYKIHPAPFTSSPKRQITEKSNPVAHLKTESDLNRLIGMLKEIPVHPSAVPLLINYMTVQSFS